MRYLENWLPTKPSQIQLLDIAYAVTIFPLLFIIKLPMVFFLVAVLYLLLHSKKPSGPVLTLLALFGLFSILASLYGSFSFAGLSRLKLFVELLIYLLFVAVGLQRLTGKVNFYLKVSPVLLLGLSLFFFQSLGMLFYVVFEVFVLLFVTLWQTMQTPFKPVLRAATIFFLSGLPIMVLFFIFFPRISFEHASYGFRGEVVKHTGHDGVMHIDNNALLVPSERIIMEVSFEDRIPSPDQLYFRGSVLYTKEKNTWMPLRHKPKNYDDLRFYTDDELTHYKVTLYPTDKKWLYLLDQPYKSHKKAEMDSDFETTMKRPVKEPVLYKASSCLRDSIDTPLPPFLRAKALYADRTINPKSLKVIAKINDRYHTAQDRLNAIQSFLREQKLTYTLKPEPFDLDNATDSFLFNTKKGYCVHFAAAFTNLARMAGIPTRIVTGYKPDGSDSVENYLIVRQSDAHAWVEVYIDEEWQRIETTAYAAFIEDQPQTANRDAQETKEKTDWDQLKLYLHYIKYQIDTWILEYSSLSQKKLFSYFKTDLLFVLKFVAVFLLFLFSLFLTWILFKQVQCTPKSLCTLQPLLKRLEKRGFRREEGESLNHYFTRLQQAHSLPLEQVNQLYHALRYRKHPADQSTEPLKKEVQRLLSTL